MKLPLSFVSLALAAATIASPIRRMVDLDVPTRDVTPIPNIAFRADIDVPTSDSTPISNIAFRGADIDVPSADESLVPNIAF